MREDLQSDFRLLERIFLALGDKTRLKLLALMVDGPVAVGFLADRLGESQPKVSRHLAYMRLSGIVSTRRDGKWIYYGISLPEHPASREILENVISALRAVSVDGKYVYFTETDAQHQAALAGYDARDEFADTRPPESDDESRIADLADQHDDLFPIDELADVGEYDRYSEADDWAGTKGEEDMDVFLL